MAKRILILGNSRLVVFGFRSELIDALICCGYDVWVSFPNGPFGEGERESAEHGCRFIETAVDRRGTSIIGDLRLLLNYIILIRKTKPDIVLSYTAKCDVYGGLACRVSGVPFVANITGLGKGLAEGGKTAIVLRLLYKVALAGATMTYFQNESDKTYFEQNSLVGGKLELLPGSGVNLEKFQPLTYPLEINQPVVFLYMARVMAAKGIDEFLNVARRAKRDGLNAEFRVAGYCEEAYEDTMELETTIGTIRYLGLVNNVLEQLSEAHCVVLPSYHPEGVSNTLLEAAACARPVITTDHPGCRETVEDGISGLIVQPQDSDALYEAVCKLVNMTGAERSEMGLAGRKKVEREFDRRKVVDSYINLISATIGKPTGVTAR